MQITIPFKTPTINHLYWHRGNLKIMKKEARELKKKIKEIVDECIKGIAVYEDIINEAYPLKVSVEIYENWYCLNGEIKKKDIANREKFLIDAVFEALGLDDKYIFSNTMTKINSETEEKAVITIINGI